MKKCFGYVRVSTAKQGSGVSLSEQRDAIESYARQHDLDIVEWFEEKETAAKRGRRAFSQMLTRLKKREVDALVVHKIDRSARNLRDWADLGDLMDQGIQVRFAHESLDTETRGGRLSADIQAVVAADFIRNLRDETRKGHLGRLKQGLLPYAAPIGYLDAGRAKVKPQDPERAPFIQKAFELYHTGDYSITRLADELYRLGLRTKGAKKIHRGYLHVILRNPFYAGTIKLKSTGEVFPGKHEPLVPRRLFDAVQDRLSGRAIKKVFVHDYLFRRLFTCTACSRMLVGERQKQTYVYYRCHAPGCPSRCIREERLDELVRSNLALLQFTPKERQYVEERLERAKDQSEARAESLVEQLERQAEIMKTRLTRLTTVYLDGDVDETTYQATRESYLAKQQTLADQRQTLREHPEAGVHAAIDTFELAASALQTYDSGTTPHKRRLIEAVSSNRVLQNNQPSIELRFPFCEMAMTPSVQRMSDHRDKIRTVEQLKAALGALLSPGAMDHR